MKYIAPMMMLALLAACNGGGNGKGNKSREFVNTAAGRAERGMVINERTSGTGLVFDASTDGVSIGSRGRESTKVLIAIRGNKLYFYERAEYEGGGTSVTVNAEAIPTFDELSAVLNTPGYTRVGDRVLFSLPSRPDSESYGDTEVTYDRVYSGSVSLSNSFCDQTSTYARNNVRATTNGVTTVLGNAAENNVTTCAPKMSREEMKQIDLSSIEFCDYTADDIECETKDMSHLTADIQ